MVREFECERIIFMKKIVGFIFGIIFRFGVLVVVLGGGFVFGGVLIVVCMV